MFLVLRTLIKCSDSSLYRTHTMRAELSLLKLTSQLHFCTLSKVKRFTVQINEVHLEKKLLQNLPKDKKMSKIQNIHGI